MTAGIATTVRFLETKAAYKTTEFYAWIVVSSAILIASASVDNGEDGQGFGADKAWKYVAWVAFAYILSRGLGSPAPADANTTTTAEHGATREWLCPVWFRRR